MEKWVEHFFKSLNSLGFFGLQMNGCIDLGGVGMLDLWWVGMLWSSGLVCCGVMGRAL